MAKVIVDPVTRIEGHLKIEVEVEGGQVVSAHSSGTLFRGLELILQGHDPRDAQEVVQRICGVCPIGHATAATLALDDAFDIAPPSNGRIIRNLILGANYIQSHILHFYHLAALDYVKAPDTIAPLAPRYEGDYRLPEEVNSAAVNHYIQALEMRKKAHEMLAIFGGRMPGQRAIVPGGVTETVDAEKILEFKFRLQELISFINNVYIPDVLAVASVYKDWLDIGRGCKNLLAYGAFPVDDNGTLFFTRGCYTGGADRDFDPAKVTEDVKYSWYDDDTIDKHPGESVITPAPDKEGAYSWLKAPRYDGKVHEVGPLARIWISKDQQLRALGEKAFSVMGRHAARAQEAKMVAEAMLDWLGQLEPGKPTCNPHKVPNQATGMGLTEAARGALGHWIKIEAGRVAKYNAVVPTTWNGSPRDEQGQPGPIEQALVGTPVKDPNNPIEVVRVVRAFDPCIACAVHVITPDRKLRKFRVY
ncbi:MAG: nickel-dependent hydrogenase large subunit [Bacillota bacterium]|jgi:hydrogenase large subunit|nr:nickel-dependent hydrogenase large subunit [Bacillota bacterium]